jgi:hypothetical protein
MIYGYARVSTGSQSVSVQVVQLKEAGATTVFAKSPAEPKPIVPNCAAFRDSFRPTMC